jgi:S1-C subfamily serine protease
MSGGTPSLHEEGVTMREAYIAITLILGVAVLAGSQDRPTGSSVADLRSSVVELRGERRRPHDKLPPSGSAFVIAPEYLVTCWHVAFVSDPVRVQFADGTSLPAQRIAGDADAELALLHVPDLNLTPLPLATSPPVVGSAVWAVGNPYGYRGTVSHGIISGIGRAIDMPNGTALRDLIQTDAAINPGNSGGPLLNDAGEVVGIAVALRESSNGIAFAVPVEQIRAFLGRTMPKE